MNESTRHVDTALIQGANRGIGLELVRQLVERGTRVVATCRPPGSADALQALAAASGQVLVLQMDVTDERSIADAAEHLKSKGTELDLLFNVAGVLHDGEVQPEKRLEQISPRQTERVFAVNAYGPLLVAKHFYPLLVHGRPAVLANMSARVGSIGDNRLGGWYAYRASKAAQNMFTRNLAIELGRKSKRIAVIAIHPGTVDTGLSEPFSRGVPDDKLFDVDRAARQLLDVIGGVGPDKTGRFFAWDGEEIEW